MATNIIVTGSTPSETITVGAEKIILTDAQIKALPSAPITLVPAPGVGKIIYYLNGAWRLDNVAGAYTNVNSLGVALQVDTITAGDAAQIETYLANEDTSPYIFSANSTNAIWEAVLQSDLENKPLILTVTNGAPGGDFTGGNAANTLSITIYYVIIDV